MMMERMTGMMVEVWRSPGKDAGVVDSHGIRVWPSRVRVEISPLNTLHTFFFVDFFLFVCNEWKLVLKER